MLSQTYYYFLLNKKNIESIRVLKKTIWYQGKINLVCIIDKQNIKFKIMKTKNVLKTLLGTLLIAGFIFSGCKKDEEKANIVPSNFKVDVPSAINAEATTTKSAQSDTLSGNDIYGNLRTFVHVGCVAADMVNHIMVAIWANNINQAMSLDYVSNDDHRSKHLVVIEGASFEGVSYQFRLTITDQGSNAMQVFWNTNPVKGVAIMNPYNINRTTETIYQNTMFRVDYSEAGENNFEKQMVVFITDFPMQVSQPWSINNLKMFVGKNGNQLTLWGNSNHPVATLVDPSLQGKDYAFIAHSDASLNIGCAQVAITPNTVNTTTDLFTTYSLYNVLNSEIHTVYDPYFPGGMPQNVINSYLKNTDVPAYFIAPQGFVSCGTNIPNNSGFTASFRDLSGLTPYVPYNVKNLSISFQ